MTGGSTSGLRPTAARLFAGPGDPIFVGVVVGLGVAAVAGWRWTGYLLVAAIGVRLAMHLAAGYAGFREAMERPRPQVRPRSWDDDDDL